MPVVPRVEGPSVALQAAPNAYRNTAGATPDAFGGGTAQLASQATQALGQYQKFAQQEADIADQVRVDDAINKAKERQIELTFGDAGFTNLRGKSALERESGMPLEDEFGTEYRKTLAELTEGLGNDRQKRAFAMRANDMLTGFRQQVTQHRGKETQTYRLSVREGTIENRKTEVGYYYNDPGKIDEALLSVRAAVTDAGKVMGLAAEQIEAKARVETSNALVIAFSSAMAKEDFKSAGAILDTYGQPDGAMLPGDLAKARGMLKSAQEIQGDHAAVLSFADRVMAANMSEADALAEARKSFADRPKVVDDAVQQVKIRFNERAAADAEAAKKIGRDAWSSVMATGRMPGASMLADLRTKAPEEERQMRDWLDARARRAKDDAEGRKTDGFDTFYGLVRMAQDEPAKFASLDLRKVAPLVGKEQINSLVRMQTGISKSDAKAMEEQQMVKSTLGLIKGEVAAIGIDLSPKEGSPQAKETAIFLGALSQSLMQAAQAKGAPLTSDEAKRIGMNMVREGVEQGSGIFGFGQTKKRGYQIATDPNIKPGASFIVAPFGKIPEDVRNKLTTEYRAAKGLGTRPLTSDQEAEIERAYTRGVQQGRF
jgi:hypothetical protein